MSWGGGGSGGGGGGGSGGGGGGSMGGRSFDSFPGVHDNITAQQENEGPVVPTAPPDAGAHDPSAVTGYGPTHEAHGNDTETQTTHGEHLTDDSIMDHAPDAQDWQDSPHERLEGRAFLDQAYPDGVYKRRLAEHAFRLIRLSAGPDRTPRVSLHEFKSFSVCPPYAALSWHWGADTLTYRISLHNYDVKIAVRPTCYELLWHLSRPSGRPQYYWIDAICINQKDPIEKAQQVSMMGHIYSQAEHVIAYVGAPDEASSAIFEKANKSQVSGSTYDAKFLLQFMERPWFSRSWVIQEVLLANRIVLRAGSRSLEWKQFERYYSTTTHSNLDPGSISKLQGQDLVQLRRWYIEQVTTVLAPLRKEAIRAGNMTQDLPPIGGLEFSQLYELMQRTWHYVATLQRDKIFAILSLFSEPFPTRLQPDYLYKKQKKGFQSFQRSDEQIFAALSVFMLKHCDCNMWSIGWRHAWGEHLLTDQSTVLQRVRASMSSLF